MPYVAINAEGVVVSISSQPFTFKEVPENQPVETGWIADQKSWRFISPELGRPWSRWAIDGVAIDAITITSTTESLPFSYTKTDGTIRAVETVYGSESVQLGDVVALPAPHATPDEIKSLSLDRDFVTVIPRANAGKITKP